MKPCEHCGEELRQWQCEDCCGYGYHWHPDGAGSFFAVDCHHCGGRRTVEKCVNLDCPGIVWYPLRFCAETPEAPKSEKPQ